LTTNHLSLRSETKEKRGVKEGKRSGGGGGGERSLTALTPSSLISFPEWEKERKGGIRCREKGERGILGTFFRGSIRKKPEKGNLRIARLMKLKGIISTLTPVSLLLEILFQRGRKGCLGLRKGRRKGQRR